MLTTYPAFAHAEAHGARKASWLDLLDPTPDERSIVESDYGLKLPSRADLSEGETSTRISEENGVLFLSMPVVSHARAFEEAPSPIGFVLSKDVLVTIRYTQLRSFDAAAGKFSKNATHRASGDTLA